MKQFLSIAVAMVACATSAFAQDEEKTVQRWNLTSVAAEDVSNISADSNWKTDSKSRYCYVQALDKAPLTANGKELATTQNLLFNITAHSDGNVRLGGKTAALWLGDATSFVIPDCKAGDMVQVEYMTSNKSANRSLTLTNLEGTFPSTTGKEHQTGSGKVVADGDVVIGITGGIYF